MFPKGQLRVQFSICSAYCANENKSNDYLRACQVECGDRGFLFSSFLWWRQLLLLIPPLLAGLVTRCAMLQDEIYVLIGSKSGRDNVTFA